VPRALGSVVKVHYALFMASTLSRIAHAPFQGTLILGVLNAEDARIFVSEAEAADYIARGELSPVCILRVEDDAPARDISEDLARAAWVLLAKRFDPFDETPPDFLISYIPELDDIIDAMRADQTAEDAHVRFLSSPQFQNGRL
jgi:hypothetical protein